MSESDDSVLKMVLEAEDQSESVLDTVASNVDSMGNRVEEALEGSTEKASVLGDSFTTSGQTITVALAGAGLEAGRFGEAVTKSMNSVKVATEEFHGTLEKATAGLANAGRLARESGDEVEKVGRKFGGAGKEGKDLGDKVEQAANKIKGSMRNIRDGTELATSEGAKFTKELTKTGSEIIALVASGNMWMLGLTVLTTGYGILTGKLNEAAKEAKKLADEQAKAADKQAKDSTKAAEDATKGELDLRKGLLKAETELEAQRLQERGKSTTASEILARREYETRLDALKQSVVEEQRLLAEAKTASGSGNIKSDAERKSLDEAVNQREIALKAKETQVHLLEVTRQRTLSVDKAKEERAEQEKIDKEAKEAYDTIRKIVNARAAETEKIVEGLKRRQEVLAMTETERKHASEILTIRELEGKGYEQLARYAKAVLEAEIARDKVAEAKRAKDDADKKDKATESEILKSLRERADKNKEVEGIQGKINDLQEEYQKMADKTVGLSNADMLLARIRAQYVKDAVEAMTEYNKKLQEAADKQAQSNMHRGVELEGLRGVATLEDNLARAREQGDLGAVVRITNRLEKLKESVAEEKALGPIRDQIAEAEKAHNDELVERLKHRLELEKEILKVKTDQVAQTQAQKDAELIGQAGMGVSVDSRGNVHVDRGIKKRRNAKKKREKERNLATDLRSRDAFGGDKNFGGTFGTWTPGVDDGNKFVNKEPGDMEWTQGYGWHDKGATIPDLGGGPSGNVPAPKESDIAAPGANTGEGLAGTIKQLEDAAKQSAESAKATKTALDQVNADQKSVAESGRGAAEASKGVVQSTTELKTHIAELTKQLNDLMTQMSSVGGKSGEALTAIATKIGKVSDEWEAYKKKLDDAIKVATGA